MISWREHVTELVEFLEGDEIDDERMALLEVIMFVGESEQGGIGAYLDRRNADAIATVRDSAQRFDLEPIIYVTDLIRECEVKYGIRGTKDQRFDRMSELIDNDIEVYEIADDRLVQDQAEIDQRISSLPIVLKFVREI